MRAFSTNRRQFASPRSTMPSSSSLALCWVLDGCLVRYGRIALDLLDPARCGSVGGSRERVCSLPR
jgi:hypothetical protein